MDDAAIQTALRAAISHQQAGKFLDAEALYQQVLAQHANQPDALHLLGVLKRQTGQPRTAMELIASALTFRPHWPQALSNLAHAARQAGQLPQALDAFERAIDLDPDNARLLTNLGTVLTEMGRTPQAIAMFEKAIALNPDLAIAHENLGIALKERGQIDQAIAATTKAVALDPGSADAHASLAHMLLLCGQLEAAKQENLAAIKLAPHDSQLHSNFIFSLNYFPGIDDATMAAQLAQWNAIHALPLQPKIAPTSNPAAGRRLRIGYVSADFRRHSVSRFLLPLLQQHDPSQFEIFAYAQVIVRDEMTAQLRAQVNVWRNTVGMSEQNLAAQIREDQIDVLFDLSLHTTPNRLLVFAQKPAPVQITWLGYPGSTGMTAIDYRFSDPFLDPPGDQNFYSEKTLHLCPTYWCYQPSPVSPAVGPLPALANGHITFGCLNNFSKVSDPVINAWICLLNEVSASRLLVHTNGEISRRHLLARFASGGIAPDRIQCSAGVSEVDYFQLYNRIDIALDTFPFAGGTTTLDALWMGVPVVTLKGHRVCGRSGVSILSNCGLTDLVADSIQIYLEIAKKLASDIERLVQLRSSLRTRLLQSPLTDAPKFAKDFERLIHQAWQGRLAEHSA